MPPLNRNPSPMATSQLPVACCTDSATYPPSRYTPPWARFVTRTSPNSSVKPLAIRK